MAGYSVVVETVFAWPGLGLTAIQAIEREDLILLQAIVFTVAIIGGADQHPDGCDRTQSSIPRLKLK